MSSGTPANAMELQLKVDTRGLFKAFKKLPKETSKELRVGMKVGLNKIARAARGKRMHRYTTRTGNLERSIQTKVAQDGLSGVVWIDPKNSNTMTKGGQPYGVYIHEGFKSWDPDPFVYKAAEAKGSELVRELETAIGEAIRKAGLQ